MDEQYANEDEEDIKRSHTFRDIISNDDDPEWEGAQGENNPPKWNKTFEKEEKDRKGNVVDHKTVKTHLWPEQKRALLWMAQQESTPTTYTAKLKNYISGKDFVEFNGHDCNWHVEFTTEYEIPININIKKINFTLGQQERIFQSVSWKKHY